jgi:hypothetical protein
MDTLSQTIVVGKLTLIVGHTSSLGPIDLFISEQALFSA